MSGQYFWIHVTKSRVAPIPLPVSVSASDTTLNAVWKESVSTWVYAPIKYHIIYLLQKGTLLLPSSILCTCIVFNFNFTAQQPLSVNGKALVKFQVHLSHSNIISSIVVQQIHKVQVLESIRISLLNKRDQVTVKESNRNSYCSVSNITAIFYPS